MPVLHEIIPGQFVIDYGYARDVSSVQSREFYRSRSEPRRHKPNPLTDADYSLLEYSDVAGYIDIFRPAYGQHAFGPYAQIRRGLTNHPELLTGARNKILEKLKNQKVNLGVALATTNQTANFFSKTCKTLYKGVRSLASRDPKSFKRLLNGASLRDVPSRWLEHQYASVPLLLDLKGSFDEMKSAYSEKPPTLQLKVRKSLKQVYLPEMQAGRWVSQFVFDGYGDYGAEVGLKYSTRNEVLRSLGKTGFTNPAEIVWELVPFSFVFDWMLPVGSWLSSFDASFGFEFETGYETTFRKEVTQFSRFLPSQFDNVSQSLTSKPKSRVVEVSRVVLKDFPSAELVFKNPVSTSHVANGMSLLALLFGR